MSTIPDSVHQDTLAARYAVNTDDNHGAVIPPLYMSSNFSFHGLGEKREYDYSRSGNPNRDQLAGALAALEGGAGGVITASGMSAVHLVTQLVKPGELIVAPHDCYGGCHRLFTAASNRGLFELEWLPPMGFNNTYDLAKWLKKDFPGYREFHTLILLLLLFYLYI